MENQILTCLSQPLSDIFSATPKGAQNPFALTNNDRSNAPRVEVAADPQPSSPPRINNNPITSPTRSVASPKPLASKPVYSMVDSGYHGSQSQDVVDVDMHDESTQAFDTQEIEAEVEAASHASPERSEHMRTSPEPPVDDDDKENDAPAQSFDAHNSVPTSSTRRDAPQESTTPAGSPKPHILSTSPEKSSSPMKTSPPKPVPAAVEEPEAEPEAAMEVDMEDEQEAEQEADPDTEDVALDDHSPSDGSSPIRPIVRKSSLNFASLPAREPITHKSIGNRISRVSHLDQHRTSYYNRPTGGKSLGPTRHDSSDDENDDDDLDMDDEPVTQKPLQSVESDNALAHNKTYTQRLQDQINKLGQSQAKPSRPSKSIPDTIMSQQPPAALSNPQPAVQRKPVSSSPKKPTTPGAFPADVDDEDDWIEPLGTPDGASGAFSPRPAMPKSHSADVMEGLTGKETVGGDDFAMSDAPERDNSSKSPEHSSPLTRTASTPAHHKSASVPALPLMDQAMDDDTNVLKKSVSVSNPPLATVHESERPTTPKSPSRGFRDGPLKQVKNKLSSILKSSKGLLASSAAISAEGKSSLLLSPSATKLPIHGAPSMDNLQQTATQEPQPLYPDLSRHALDAQPAVTATSPVRTEGRRTRASIEKEKAEERRKEKEAKEARRAAEQMEKLEKAREKEREKARVFSKEQDRVAALEKQATTQKEQEKKTVPPTPNQASKPARTSPRKTKAQLEAEERAAAVAATSEDQPTDDIEMVDAPNTKPPPSIPRSIPPPSASKPREIKRPVKPAKEPAGKAKQAPTVIRVNMNSQNSQHHPSNTALSSSLHDTLASSSNSHKSKGSQSSIQKKPSLQSLKNSVSSASRPKALEMAARRKEQEEREAQRKRDAKAEMERKRTAMQDEEKRQEQQRKLEAERQREEERKQTEAKKNAQRQAMLEKAKQTRAPPPAVRNQPNGPPDYNRPQDKGDAPPARPPSRLNMNRSQEELGRPVNASLPSTAKAASKRPLQPEEATDKSARPGPSRPGTSYQTKETKRMRMTDEFDDDGPQVNQSSLKGAPIRPSAGGYKKVNLQIKSTDGFKLTKYQEIPSKPMFPAGYTNAPPSATRDLFKSTLTSQHTSHMKPAHPLDMAQFSKGAIPFAPNPNPAGPASHKTPARPQGVAAVKSTAKSTTKSSPRFQNGESIELPEINTDDEDSDSDDGGGGGKDLMAAWADSPELRRALVEQESKDPFQIFGAPGPLNMEEVFAKSKDRFHKFRARTSSANWSGLDRLTDEDIRKDLAARDKMRREGGWTYEMSKELA